jgi:hypothetical protein
MVSYVIYIYDVVYIHDTTVVSYVLCLMPKVLCLMPNVRRGERADLARLQKTGAGLYNTRSPCGAGREKILGSLFDIFRELPCLVRGLVHLPYTQALVSAICTCLAGLVRRMTCFLLHDMLYLKAFPP